MRTIHGLRHFTGPQQTELATNDDCGDDQKVSRHDIPRGQQKSLLQENIP